METQFSENDTFLPVFNFDKSQRNEISENVDKLFESFRMVYTFKFVGKNPKPEDYIELRKGFTWAARPFSAKVLSQAVDRWINPWQGDKHDNSWPPVPQEFFQLCKAIDPNWRKSCQKKTKPEIFQIENKNKNFDRKKNRLLLKKTKKLIESLSCEKN